MDRCTHRCNEGRNCTCAPAITWREYLPDLARAILLVAVVSVVVGFAAGLVFGAPQ